MSLKRALGPLQIQLISLGGIIGSGYFLGLGANLAENGAWTLLAYAVGGLIVWAVAMAMGEVSVGLPREGSFVSHARELMGRPWAAGVGWSYWFNWCAYIPAEMIAGGLILHKHFPQTPVILWAVFFGACITAVNFFQVTVFGKVESFLSLLKIGAIFGFVALALLVWMGLVGTPLSGEAATLLAKKEWAPPGMSGVSLLAMMVLVLVNYQGTEIIALSAAETKDPEHSIPRASRNVAIRTLLLYLVPIGALLLIFPWQGAKTDRSVFAEALTQSGLATLGSGLEWIILSAALSCANSGLYGAVRSLYGLAQEGLAPQWLGVLSPQGVPRRATLLTVLVAWSFLPIYLLMEGTQFYTLLLSVSGFTGAICWISISLSQILYRRRVLRSNEAASPYLMPGFPWLSVGSVFLQILCLIMVVAHPVLRPTLVIGLPVFLIPLLWTFFRRKGAQA